MDIREYIQSGMIEQYVLGLATPVEVAELEQLRDQYPELREALLNFELSFEEHVRANAIQPSASLKASIEKELFGNNYNTASGMEKSFAAATREKVTPVYNIGLWKYLAAACIVLLIVSTALNFYFYSGFKNTQQQYQALLAERNTLQANNASYKQSLDLFGDSSMRRIDLNAIPGKENNFATVLWSKKSNEVYLYSNNLQQTPAGKQYQLWAIVNGKPVSAGVVTNCLGVCKMTAKFDHAEAFAITLEKEGGSETPTLSEMYVLGKV